MTDPSKRQLSTPHLAELRTAEAVKALQDSSTHWPNDSRVVGICAITAFAFLVIASITGADGMKFQENLGSLLPTLLGSLLVVALLVERVIEVFVSVWCDREAAVHEQNLRYWQGRQGWLTNDIQKHITERNEASVTETRRLAIEALLEQRYIAIEEANRNADIEEKALVPFSARTRKVSTWIGLIVGVFVAAAGFRFLHQIVDIEPLVNNKSQQKEWFIAADVLLSGAVLAGGSKLIHRIFSVYDSFMKSTQTSFADRSKTSS